MGFIKDIFGDNKKEGIEKSELMGRKEYVGWFKDMHDMFERVYHDVKNNKDMNYYNDFGLPSAYMGKISRHSGMVHVHLKIDGEEIISMWEWEFIKEWKDKIKDEYDVYKKEEELKMAKENVQGIEEKTK